MGSIGERDLFKFDMGKSISVCNLPNGVRSGEIEWSVVQAAMKDVTYPDNTEIRIGEKCLRYGTILVKIQAEGETKGKFAPFDSTANDGRENLDNDESYILNETFCESDYDSHPKLFREGNSFKARLLVGGEGQPTWDEFYLAFRHIKLITD